MNINTYIVAVAIESGSPDRPPQLALWAVRTTSWEEAERKATAPITGVTIAAVTVSSLDDYAGNVLGMPDDYIKSI